MVALNCESCGAPLKVTQENIVICEYCGNETIIAKTTADPSENIIASIPSCGASVFDKKTFNIYKQFAELVDDESGKIEQHIDFKQVKNTCFFLILILFLRCMMDNRFILDVFGVVKQKYPLAPPMY